MVIGLLVIAGIPTTIGVCEALSAQKKANNAAKEKAKFQLTATVSLDGKRLDECWCVLKDGKIWLDHPDHPAPGHKFMGYYFTYPSEEKHLGMVSTIADDPPMLNWIFVDKDTGLVRHGGRQETLGGHTIGPWYWTDDERRLTLEEDDSAFVAVWMEENKKWAIAYDRDGSIRDGGWLAASDDEEEEEEGEEGGEEDGDKGTTPHRRSQRRGGRSGGRRRQKWAAIRLNRKMQLGMESRYVKGEGGR
ncbi:hypothetical protein GQ53DRAFT_842630 [Thozetella sp. PMI_491]|nr:hypothetical protein GQ53DRAFT_842630 [Thozetella sp. PMI_491]